jgi:hypothetical protein
MPEVPYEPVDGPEHYGVDWEAYSDENVMVNFFNNNSTGTVQPCSLSIVEVFQGENPFTEAQMLALSNTLPQFCNMLSKSMLEHCIHWQIALEMYHVIR